MGNEYQRFLMHHGIKGQKWGERNGPPYPLKPSQRSTAERKAGGGTQGSTLALLATTALTLTPLAINVTSNIIKEKRAKKNLKNTMKEAEKISNDKKYASERENEEIDPETGLYLTGKKMTEEENMERINPSFDSGNAAFRTNCTACTITMELRERGYDVHAGTDSEHMLQNGGVSDMERALNWYSDDRHYSKNTKYYDGQNMEDSIKNITKFSSDLSKEPNSRGEICVDWKGGGGHSMYYKTDNKGKLTIYDTQANMKYADADARKFLLANVDSFYYTRFDQAELNIQYLKDNNYIC